MFDAMLTGWPNGFLLYMADCPKVLVGDVQEARKGVWKIQYSYLYLISEPLHA